MNDTENKPYDLYTNHRKRFYDGRVIDGTLFTVMQSRIGPSGPEVVCRCVCGREVAIPYRTLYNGYAYSCGCIARPRKPTGAGVDLSGETYGRLTVLQYLFGRGWECLCRDCQEVEVVERRAGMSYQMALKAEGRKVCARKEKRDAGKLRWLIQLGFTESAVTESYMVEVAGDTADEAKANAMDKSDDPRNKVIDVRRI